ncbi:MAG: HAD family hydrolase [Candidatus Dormibacteraeota bacterium]|nr:HAD family hydrolase [Candidatus Dormibacteraeota bacterium]
MSIGAVVFDVGETLVDETRIWGAWADAVGVPRLTFFAALGSLVQSGARDHRGVFDLVRPGLTFRKAAALRGGSEVLFDGRDLYPDARRAFEELVRAGIQVGIAANQPARAALALEACELPYDWLLISDLERVAKPDPAFFALLLQRAGLPAHRVAYVGDRIDNDVLPAAAAGLRAVHLRRGPWGVIHAGDGAVDRAALQTDRLDAVVEWARRAS